MASASRRTGRTGDPALRHCRRAALPASARGRAVVWREHGGDLQVLVVHSPRYDDWTFPKGKADPGEPGPVTSVRELAEERGQEVRLGVPLTNVDYPVGGRTKHVDYWVAQLLGSDDAAPRLTTRSRGGRHRRGMSPSTARRPFNCGSPSTPDHVISAP